MDDLENKKDKPRKSILDLAIVSFGLLASRAFMFATSIIVARASDAATFGQFALFTTIFLIVSEVPNAIDTTYIRLSSNVRAAVERHDYFATSLLLKILIGLVFISMGLFFSIFIAGAIFNKPESVQLIQVSIISGTLYSIYLAFVAYHQQQKKFMALAAMRAAFNLLVLVVVGVLFISDLKISINELATTYISIIVVMLTVAGIYNLEKIKKIVSVNSELLREFIRVGGLLITASSITLISNRLDVFFIASLLDYESLGLYNVAIRISLIIAIITGAIRTTVLPSAADAVHDAGLYGRYVRTSIGYIAILMVAALSIIILLEPIIHYTFGDDYIGANEVVIILICQAVLNGAAVPFVALIQCGPSPIHTILLSINKLIVGTVLLSLFIPSYGIYGASIGILIATTTTLIMAIVIAMRSRPSQ